MVKKKRSRHSRYLGHFCHFEPSWTTNKDSQSSRAFGCGNRKKERSSLGFFPGFLSLALIFSCLCPLYSLSSNYCSSWMYCTIMKWNFITFEWNIYYADDCNWVVPVGWIEFCLQLLLIRITVSGFVKNFMDVFTVKLWVTLLEGIFGFF